MIKYPSLYQINTRVWLRELSDRLARPATLADIPDDLLEPDSFPRIRLRVVSGRGMTYYPGAFMLTCLPGDFMCLPGQGARCYLPYIDNFINR